MCIRDSGITSETEAVEALIFLVVSSYGFNSLMQCDMMSFSTLIRMLTLEYELEYEARGSLSNTSFHHMKCTIPASWNVFDNIKIWNIKPFLNCLQLIFIYIFFFRFILSIFIIKFFIKSQQ